MKSGFVNILGKPNAGKSTLLNALMREKLAIVTPKVQTTRHRILGILSEDDYQMIISDTPGFIEQPAYKMQESMMRAVDSAVEDADVVVYLLDVTDRESAHPLLERVRGHKLNLILALNKVDVVGQEETEKLIQLWQERVPEAKVIPISAEYSLNIQGLLEAARDMLPEGMPYYPPDQLTDKTERFLVSEMIREKIFNEYRQEIPYSTEVVVTAFKDEPTILRISAEIIVNRASQKPILIGKGGLKLKKIGTLAREELEKTYEKKVFLELFVKIRENWRENPRFLRQFGYEGQ